MFTYQKSMSCQSEGMGGGGGYTIVYNGVFTKFDRVNNLEAHKWTCQCDTAGSIGLILLLTTHSQSAQRLFHTVR